MLAAAAHSRVSLFFVNRKEEDQEVPMASRTGRHALSIASDLMVAGSGKAIASRSCCRPLRSCGVLLRRALRGRHPVPLYPPVRLGRLDEYHRKTAAMLRAVDAALVVTDERIRRFLGVAVSISAPRLGCVTASSLGGTNSGEIEVAVADVALIQFSSGTTHDPSPWP